jgi:hypothetical protein
MGSHDIAESGVKHKKSINLDSRRAPNRISDERSQIVV